MIPKILIAYFVLALAIVLSFYTQRTALPQWPWLAVFCAFLYCLAHYLLN